MCTVSIWSYVCCAQVKAVIWNISPNVRRDALLTGQARLINLFKKQDIWNNVIIVAKQSLSPESDCQVIGAKTTLCKLSFLVIIPVLIQARGRNTELLIHRKCKICYKFLSGPSEKCKLCTMYSVFVTYVKTKQNLDFSLAHYCWWY